MKIEEAIILKYPDCEDCHLEIDTAKNYQIDVDESTKDHLNIATSIKMESFKEEIDHIVKGEFMFDETKKKALRTRETYPFLNSKQIKRNYEFLFTELDYEYIEENLYCGEDYRFEMIKNQLDNRNVAFKLDLDDQERK